MTDKLRYQSVSQGDISYIRLYGIIDESLDPAELQNEATGREIIINLKAITRLSSFGVREWIRAIEGLASRVNRIYLVECAPPVVAQLNMIANFSGPAQVISVQVPYYCDHCGWDTTITLDLNQGQAPTQQIPCRACKHAMQMDDDPGSYLSFRSRQAPQAIDPSVVSFIRSFSESAPEPQQKIRRGKRRPSSGSVPNRDALTKLWEQHKLPIIITGACLVLALVLASLLTGGGEGIPADKLAVYHGHLAADEYEQARMLVAELHDDRRIPDTLKAHLEADIDQRKAQRLRNLHDEIGTHFRNKGYAEVLVGLDKLASLDSTVDPELLFLRAESLRKLERLKDAKPYYEKFFAEMGKSHPTDRRRDDALYWLAEAALLESNDALAAQLLQQLIDEFPSGNYKRSAQKRLRQLKP